MYVLKNQDIQIINTINNSTSSVNFGAYTPGEFRGVPVTSGNYVYVSDYANNEIVVIDIRNDTFLKSVQTGNNPTNLHLNGTKLYVSNYDLLGGQNDPGSVTVIDTITNNFITTIVTAHKPEFAANLYDKIFLGNNVTSDNNIIQVIDKNTDTITTSIAVDPYPAYGMVLVGTKLYVANSGSDSVTVIDALTNLVIDSSIPVGDFPTGIFAVADEVYVHNTNSNNLSVIDTNTDSIIATIELGSIGTDSVSYDAIIINNKYYVSTSNFLYEINTDTHSVVAKFPKSNFPKLVGKKIYSTFSNSVISVLDTENDLYINNCAPHLTSITSSTANGNYDSSQSVNISANFNENL